ncbi:MAG: type II secretion system protein [Candidatus Daviesbacteria bacterium]
MKYKGFTLIELLIVISILGILGSIGLVTFSRVQANARDAVRREQINIIAAAIQSSKRSDGFYSFTTANLSTEFPNDARVISGKDPSDVNYCVGCWGNFGPPTGPANNSDATWFATAEGCPLGFESLSRAVSVTQSGCLGRTTPDTNAWALCAKLELGTSAFCRYSLAR